MMIQATEEESRIMKQIKESTDQKEKVALFNRLVELSKEQDEKLKNCPLAH